MEAGLAANEGGGVVREQAGLDLHSGDDEAQFWRLHESGMQGLGRECIDVRRAGITLREARVELDVLGEEAIDVDLGEGAVEEQEAPSQ